MSKIESFKFDDDAPPRRANPPAVPGPHAPEEADDEVVYYTGSPLLRGELGRLVVWTVIGAALIAGPVAWYFVDEPSWTWWVALIGVGLGAGALLIPSVLVRRTHYRITNYRIDHERGLLSKDIDTLELWHVNDIGFHQSLTDRLFNVGTITIDSDDRSTPRLELKSLADPRPLYEQLKQRVIAVKRQRGVIKMDF